MSENLNNNLPENDAYIIGKGFEVEEIEIEEKPKKTNEKTKKCY